MSLPHIAKGGGEAHPCAGFEHGAPVAQTHLNYFFVRYNNRYNTSLMPFLSGYNISTAPPYMPPFTPRIVC